MDKPNCWKCDYVGGNPGSAHARCLHPLVKSILVNNPLGEICAIFASVGRMTPVVYFNSMEALEIELNPHGVANGWANWPWEFDPVWLLSCKGFKEKKNEKA